jgi:hypothetical protein
MRFMKISRAVISERAMGPCKNILIERMDSYFTICKGLWRAIMVKSLSS